MRLRTLLLQTFLESIYGFSLRSWVPSCRQQVAPVLGPANDSKNFFPNSGTACGDAMSTSDSNQIAIRLALTLGFHSKPGRFARDSNPLTDLPGGKLPTPDKSGDRTCGFF